MPAVRDAELPTFTQARETFTEAMDQWDPEKADAAIAALARGASENELFELMAHYGSRDFRDIGHKAIFVANAFRTLGCIGWQHAEPVLRSLTYALQCRGNDPHPAKHELRADLPERQNRELIDSVRDDWEGNRDHHQATETFLELLHEADERTAAEAVARQLNAGVSARSLYDALYLSAAEMLMRRPNIISLHAVTMTNALGYAYRRVRQPKLRLRLLFQNASFLAMFLARLQEGSPLASDSLTQLTPDPIKGTREEAIEGILAKVNQQNGQAAAEALGLLEQDNAAATDLIGAARRLVFLKGTNSHDYKFSSAVLEDFHHISPAWRNRYLAAAVYKLRGTLEPDTQLLPADPGRAGCELTHKSVHGRRERRGPQAALRR